MESSLFQVHMLNAKGKSRAVSIQRVFEELLNHLEPLCFDDRTFAICRTKLEQACFYAKKSMAGDPSNNEEQL